MEENKNDFLKTAAVAGVAYAAAPTIIDWATSRFILLTTLLLGSWCYENHPFWTIATGGLIVVITIWVSLGLIALIANIASLYVVIGYFDPWWPRFMAIIVSLSIVCLLFHHVNEDYGSGNDESYIYLIFIHSLSLVVVAVLGLVSCVVLYSWLSG